MAGAENGNNAAITKTSPNVDANGMYTVQQGDTWSDIAQRATGDMNNYQKMYDAQGGKAGGNIDNLAAGTQVNLSEFLNDTGNAGVSGDKTNPAGGGQDKNPATTDAGPTVETGLGGLSTANGFAGGAPKVDTSAASDPGSTATATPPAGDTATDAVKPAEAPPAPAPAAPKPTAGSTAEGSRRTAREWLRWAAETEGTTSNSTTTSTPDQPTDAVTTTSPASGPSGNTRSTPATNPAQTAPGTPSRSETFDPANPAEVERQSQNSANPGTQAGGSNSMLPSSGTPGMGGMDMGDVGGMIGQGVGAATDIASGIGQALPGIVQGIGSIFASKSDFDNWVRYAYPEAGEAGDLEPHDHPFAGSGYPGSLEFSTSEEYADTARKKMDDVTDLGDDPLSTPMGEWQKQAASNYGDEPLYDSNPADCGHNDQELLSDGASIHCRECGTIWGPKADEARTGHEGWNPDDDQDPFDPRLIGASHNEGAGRFDDIAGAAQGFLRTAGRNYSLAEQSELIREGDKGGARNLDSLDLRGTHYEDMETLGW